jgi:hypothetical protein
MFSFCASDDHWTVCDFRSCPIPTCSGLFLRHCWTEAPAPPLELDIADLVAPADDLRSISSTRRSTIPRASTRFWSSPRRPLMCGSTPAERGTWASHHHRRILVFFRVVRRSGDCDCAAVFKPNGKWKPSIAICCARIAAAIHFSQRIPSPRSSNLSLWHFDQTKSNTRPVSSVSVGRSIRTTSNGYQRSGLSLPWTQKY